MNKQHIAATLKHFNDNIQRHLFVISRATQSKVRDVLREKGYQDLSNSYSNPIMSLAYGPERVTELAKNLSISKQHCVQILRPMETAGYIKKKSDPSDGRAKLVMLTSKGEHLLDDSKLELANIVKHYSRTIGKQRTQQLRNLLLDLYTQQIVGNFSGGRHLEYINEANILIPALIAPLSKYLDKRLIDLIRARGHSGISASYLQVLLYLTPQGSSVQDIAKINDIGVQAVERIANELDSQGYLIRSHSKDGGIKRELRLTSEGLQLLIDLADSIKVIEADAASSLGSKQYASLVSTLTLLYKNECCETEQSFAFDKQDYDETLLRNLSNNRQINLGAEELLLFIATLFDKSKQRRSHHIKLSSNLSERHTQLMSFSDTAKRTMAETIIDIDLINDELRRRFGEKQLDNLKTMISQFSNDLDYR